MATAVAYLKAMTAAGLSIDQACRPILFTYSVPCDQFLGICKLRRRAQDVGAPRRGLRCH